MSREAKQLLTQLETERQQLIDLHRTLEQQVAAGTITETESETLFKQASGGRSYEEAYAQKNAHVHEAKVILHDERKEVVRALTPGFALIAVGLVMLWSFSGITGLFTLSDQSLYRSEVGRAFMQDGSLSLAFPDGISSLRLNGEAAGTGTARVWLQTASGRLLVARFDAEDGGSSPLTGLFTDDTGTLGTTDGNAVAEATNGSNATEAASLPETTLEEADPLAPRPDTSIEETTVEETTVIHEPTATDETVLLGNVSNETNVTVALPPIEEETEATEPEPGSGPGSEPELEAAPTPAPSTVTFEQECLETCAMPPATPPYTLVVEIAGDVTLTIESITYGVPKAQVALPDTVEPQPSNESDGANETIPGSVVVPLTNVTGGTVVEPAIPGAPLLADGVQCALGTDCLSGVCADSVYQGVPSPKLCAPSTAYCAAGSSLFSSGQAYGESVCLEAAAESAWLVASGSGRFTVRNAANETVAVIDKFGTMAIAGNAVFNTDAGASGWVLRDAGGTARISIDSAGNLRASGALHERASPAPTAGSDFIVQEADGTVHAVLAETGDITLSGDLVAGAALS